jgi:hypothetical protein
MALFRLRGGLREETIAGFLSGERFVTSRRVEFDMVSSGPVEQDVQEIIWMLSNGDSFGLGLDLTLVDGELQAHVVALLHPKEPQGCRRVLIPGKVAMVARAMVQNGADAWSALGTALTLAPSQVTYRASEAAPDSPEAP